MHATQAQQPGDSSSTSTSEHGATTAAAAHPTSPPHSTQQMRAMEAYLQQLPIQVAAPGEVHPAAAKLFHACPWLRHFPVLGIAMEGFGPKFCLSLGAVDFMTKGVAENTINLSRQPMLVKRMGCDATRYQRLAGIMSMGASMKVVMAVLSDAFALFGYRKRWYMLGSCVMGFAFALGYALLPAKPASADIAAAFIFLCTFCRTNVDILSQGFYSRMIQRSPHHGPALISWVYWMVLLGIIVAAVIMGPLSDKNKTRDGVIVSAVFHLVPAFVFVLNLYGERKNRAERCEDALLAQQQQQQQIAGDRYRAASHEPTSEGKELHPERHDDEEGAHTGKHADVVITAQAMDSGEEGQDGLVGFSNLQPHPQPDDGALTLREDIEDCDFVDESVWVVAGGVVEVNTTVLRENWRIVVYAVVMTCSVITLACVTILGTKWDLLYACIAVIVACAACAFATLPLVIAKANVFVFFDVLSYIRLPGALDSFYLADEACVPGGPHFSYTFYSTIGAVIQNIAGMLGVALFTYVFSKHRYQLVMFVTVTLRVVASIFDLMLVERWNLHIGIPDHAIYILGDAIIYQVCYMLNSMPVLMLLARVAQPGSESIMFGLMAGMANLGMSMSNTIGSLLMEMVWPVDTKSTPCDFSNVRWLIITGHMAAPFLMVVAAFVLLPAARVSDALDMEGNVIPAKPNLSESTQEETMTRSANALNGAGDSNRMEPTEDTERSGEAARTRVR